MAKQKKEKQIPVKQQMYEQIITKQLYGDRPTREEGIAKLQADYDTWKARQDGIAKLQADYDAWQKAQQPQQPVEAPQIEKPVQKTVRNTPAVEVKAPEEKKKYLTHADVLPTLTKRSADVTQNPEMARLGQGGGVDLFNRPKVATSFVKKAGWDDVGEGQATVYSSTYSNAKGNKAANFTPIVADSQGNYIKTLSQEELEKYAEDVINGRRKDDLKLQIGKTKQGEKAIDDAVKDAERIHELQEDYYIEQPKRQKEELKKKNEATSIKKIAKQLNISEAEVKARMQEPKNEAFVSPDSVNLASEEAQYKSDVEKMNKLLDPSKKLTDQEKREAKEVARRILDVKGNPNVNRGYDKERADAVNLMNKTNAFTNFMQGVINPYYRIAKPIDKKIAGAEDKAREGVASVLDNIGITKNGKEEALREIAERRTEREEKNASMENAYKNAQIQNPLGATAGNLAGMLSQYYLTNPLFDAAAGALGITGRAGKFLVNQLGQNAQDVALDTLPKYSEFMEDGTLSDEERKELKKDAAWNAVGNLIPGIIGDRIEAKKAAQAAAENKAAEAVMENAAQNIPDISDMAKWNRGFMPNAENALYDTSSARKAIDNALNAEDIAKQVEVPKAPEIVAPKIEKPVAQSIDNVPRKLTVEEVNRAGGKKGYYVAEVVDDVSKNVEPGKVYKSREAAEEALNKAQNKVMPAEMEGYKSNVPSSRAAEPIEENWELKERGQSKHIRGEGKMQMEGVSDEVVADFQDEPQLYAALKNSETKAKAENIYNTSNNPEVDFRDMLRNHDPAALPLGHQLAKDYSAAGNHEAAAQIYREMGEQLTKAGQFSQQL